MKLRNIKYFIFGLALVVTGLFVGPSISSATNQEEMIQSLIEQIKSLKKQLAQLQNETGVLSQWCYDFDLNLRFGDETKGVWNLKQALDKEGFEIGEELKTSKFGEITASAVVGFQQKYKDEILTPNGLKYGTGFVGKSTRAKLNYLYGCGDGYKQAASSSSSVSISKQSSSSERTKINWRITLLILDGIDKSSKGTQPLEEAISFIEKNSDLKISYDVVESKNSHSYTYYSCSSSQDGCVVLLAGNLDEVTTNSLPTSNSYVMLYNLNGKTPLQAGSTVGPGNGIEKGGKERIYATIPVDIWWYDDASQTNFKTRSAQIMVHEIINTIRGTLQMSPYYCTAPTGTAGDPAYIHEADNLKNLMTNCYERLKNNL